MCKNPITIKNKTQYLNNQSGQQYYLKVDCGKCSECREKKQTEWTLRTYYQMLDCLQNNGWCYFDTLTYRNEDLPRLNNYISDTNGKNYPCFNYKHIREFYETLRQYYTDDAFKYFITCEYGELRNRPHMHILLFVYDSTINQLEFSRNVSKAWKYGRTDGLPFKSKLYVQEHNICDKMNLNMIRYVSKYINKSVTYQDTIDKKWASLENYYKKSKWDKLEMKKIRQQYYRHMTPFHRQSQHYGESALKHMNIKDLWDNGIVYYKDDSLRIIKQTRIPRYFIRKLTQEQIKYKGKRIWINTEDGIEWKKNQQTILEEKVYERYKDKARELNLNYTENELYELTKYILYKQGRLDGEIDLKPQYDKAEFYNYNTDKDLKYLGKKCLSKNYAGNDKIGYQTTEIELIDEPQYKYDEKMEEMLKKLTKNNEQETKKIVLIKEHMAEIKKVYF